ncbi:THAP domain-containing protein 9 [Plakobranchus ocellatus]|uniref:THAP domain-containing protein 9 n=1 Tax=Plakobranchus ocellatus TaxID=259542 RepID=A0AAV4AMS3_9GAST|nr:THAP domain-containing protein 9 [Plakobranchus ocellatus]
MVSNTNAIEIMAWYIFSWEPNLPKPGTIIFAMNMMVTGIKLPTKIEEMMTTIFTTRLSFLLALLTVPEAEAGLAVGTAPCDTGACWEIVCAAADVA